MSKKIPVLELRGKGLTIPQICKELNIGKGTVGYYLKNYPLNLEERNKDILKYYNEGKTCIEIGKIFNLSQGHVSNTLTNLGVQFGINWDIVFYGNIEKTINGDLLKKKIIKDKLLEHKCNECSLENKWNNKNLVLHLDHINGNRKNNRLDNLRFLCPNCHSQTETYTGKNKIKKYSDEEILQNIKGYKNIYQILDNIGMNKNKHSYNRVQNIIEKNKTK